MASGPRARSGLFPSFTSLLLCHLFLLLLLHSLLEDSQVCGLRVFNRVIKTPFTAKTQRLYLQSGWTRGNDTLEELPKENDTEFPPEFRNPYKESQFVNVVTSNYALPRAVDKKGVPVEPKLAVLKEYKLNLLHVMRICHFVGSVVQSLEMPVRLDPTSAPGVLAGMPVLTANSPSDGGDLDDKVSVTTVDMKTSSSDAPALDISAADGLIYADNVPAIGRNIFEDKPGATEEEKEISTTVRIAPAAAAVSVLPVQGGFPFSGEGISRGLRKDRRDVLPNPDQRPIGCGCGG